jgi:hypothetical protein
MSTHGLSESTCLRTDYQNRNVYARILRIDMSTHGLSESTCLRTDSQHRHVYARTLRIDMSTHGLLFQCASTIKIYLCWSQRGHHIIISSKLFSPCYSNYVYYTRSWFVFCYCIYFCFLCCIIIIMCLSGW